MKDARYDRSRKETEKATTKRRDKPTRGSVPATMRQLEGAPQDISVQDLLEAKAFLDKLVHESKRRLEDMTVTDLWYPVEPISSYWILVMTGIDQSQEIGIASSILIWKEFFAKNTAYIVCLQSSDRKHFKFCSRYFKINSYPALIFSDNPEMQSSIILDGSLLHSITQSTGGLRAFLTQIHAFIERGSSMEEIKARLNSEKFWEGLKIVYKEIKSLLSISVKSSI